MTTSKSYDMLNWLKEISSTPNTGHVLLAANTEDFNCDSDGNLTGDGLWSYTWNAENRLVHLVSVAGVPDEARRALKFDYDFQGRRVSKVVSNYSGGAWVFDYQRKYVYDGWLASRSLGGGWNLLAELDVGNTLVCSYMWGADLSGSAQGAGGVGGLLAVDSASDGTQFVAYDGNGNVMGLVDGANGTLSARYEYDPFGQTIRASGEAAGSCPFGFSTKYNDEESQFLYYGYRYYNPSTGRWLNRDPIGEGGGMNTVAFVRNNGVDFWDVLGLSSCGGCSDECKPGDKQVDKIEVVITPSGIDNPDQMTALKKQILALDKANDILNLWSKPAAAAEAFIDKNASFDPSSIWDKLIDGTEKSGLQSKRLYTRIHYSWCVKRTCFLFFGTHYVFETDPDSPDGWEEYTKNQTGGFYLGYSDAKDNMFNAMKDHKDKVIGKK